MRAALLSDAQVLRVVDGDTILVRMECPCCQTWSQQRVRLARLDCPELSGSSADKGEKAKRYLASWLEGYPVRLRVRRSWPDKYGRVIAEAYRDGINVTDAMIHEGHGRLYDDSTIRHS